MTTFETEHDPHSQNSLLFLDSLICEEESWDDHDHDYNDDHDDVHEKGDDDDDDDDDFGSSFRVSQLHYDISSYLCCEEDEEEQLNDLLAKEGKPHFDEGVIVDDNKSLMEARRGAIEWMIRVKSYYNFCGITLVLGVNYFDKFMMSFGFQKEWPWMTHLVAIACLSLASKIEETYVPLLLDFQVENKVMFEAKVIQEMELLVLSTLEWKMKAVTPLSYFGHIIRKLNLKPHFQWEILCRFERLIFSAILDPRSLYYVPSVLAAATMLQTLKETGLWGTLEHQIDIMDILKLDKDKVEECYNFIQELASNEKALHKRKSSSISASRSPNNVLELLVSTSESSSDKNSSSSSSSSVEPLPKKCRTVGPSCFD